MADAEKPIPPLRPDVESVPIEHEGQPMFVLRDAEGLTDHTLALSPGGMLVASLLDGAKTASELKDLIAQQTGAMIQAADIQRVADRLAESDLLETDSIKTRRKKLLQDFLDGSVRPATMAGTGYPKETLELSKFLGAFYRDGRGPGKPPPDSPTEKAAPIGLVSPHIDLYRGGHTYAWSYGALAAAPPPDVVVAIGVAHASPASPWVLTPKAYQTPYGPMEVHQELYGDIQKALWYDGRSDEWAHRREHSLEFQALWLKSLWRDKAPAWVPVLCSTFERWASDRAPSTVPTVEKALNEIGALLAARAKAGQRVMILAGIDLAHVGPRFGDDVEVNPELQKRIELDDRRSLEKALALDADGFYLDVVKDDHWRKWCGLSALYTSLRWMKALGSKPGELLDYGQAHDPSGGIVSFFSGVYR